MSGKESGFTLMELLVVIAILIVGTSIALPQIIQMGRNSGVKSDARDLKNLLFYARMEAVKLNRSVTVVFNRDGFDYMAFVDEDDSCEYDLGTDRMLRSQNFTHATFDQDKSGDGLTFVSNDNNYPAIRWSAKGIPLRNEAGFGAGTAYLKGTAVKYSVIVSKTGNVRVGSY